MDATATKTAPVRCMFIRRPDGKYNKYVERTMPELLDETDWKLVGAVDEVPVMKCFWEQVIGDANEPLETQMCPNCMNRPIDTIGKRWDGCQAARPTKGPNEQ